MCQAVQEMRVESQGRLMQAEDAGNFCKLGADVEKMHKEQDML